MAQACRVLENDVPLRVLFEYGEKIHSQADSLLLEPGSKGEGDLQRGCEALLKCQRLVDSLALFSSNEEKDDIATGDVRYLLVPYYLADLVQRRVDGDRKAHVAASRVHLSAFVRSCDLLGFLPEGEREAITRDKAADPQARRTEKIARFKRQRAAEAKLQELLELRERRLRSSQAATQGAERDVDDNSTAPEEYDDEERQLWFLRIGVAMTKALDLLDALQREDELLKASRDDSGNLREEYQKAVMDERLAQVERQHRAMAAAAGAAGPRLDDRRHISVIGRDAIEGRVSFGGASVGPMSSRLGHAQHLSQHRCAHQVFGPVSLMSKTVAGEKDRLMSQVFQPSHVLPKYSIEQAGMMEMEMMKRWQADQRAAVEEAAAKGDKKAQKALRGNGNDGSEDDDDGDDDEAVMEARAWDEWKDEHRRGEGNSRLTPCG